MPKQQPWRCIGLLLAAGRGRRMGRTKQLLPWGAAGMEKPLVGAAFDAISEVCAEMVVVVGHEEAKVVAALGDRRFHSVTSNSEAEMYESVLAGLAVVNRLDPSATIVLQPGDHPEVGASTLRAIHDVARCERRRAIMPEYQGRGGHPVFIPATVAKLLGASVGYGGLRQFWAEHPALCRRFPVDDPTVILDLDTPDQLPQVKKS